MPKNDSQSQCVKLSLELSEALSSSDKALNSSLVDTLQKLEQIGASVYNPQLALPAQLQNLKHPPSLQKAARLQKSEIITVDCYNKGGELDIIRGKHASTPIKQEVDYNYGLLRHNKSWESVEAFEVSLKKILSPESQSLISSLRELEHQPHNEEYTTNLRQALEDVLENPKIENPKYEVKQITRYANSLKDIFVADKSRDTRGIAHAYRQYGIFAANLLFNN